MSISCTKSPGCLVCVSQINSCSHYGALYPWLTVLNPAHTTSSQHQEALYKLQVICLLLYSYITLSQLVSRRVMNRAEIICLQGVRSFMSSDFIPVSICRLSCVVRPCQWAPSCPWWSVFQRKPYGASACTSSVLPGRVSMTAALKSCWTDVLRPS